MSRVHVLGAVLGAAVVLVPFAVLERGSSPAESRLRARPLPPAASAQGLVERSGVRVVRVAVTGGGGLLDLRYEVVDPSKAAAVHDASTPPALVDRKTGLVDSALLMGHMHHGRPKAGLDYYLLFLNQGNVVRRGDRVSVVLGRARLDDVLVQ